MGFDVSDMIVGTRNPTMWNCIYLSMEFMFELKTSRFF
jgi:hypothetical protein